MVYTNEEIAMIEGMLVSLFSGARVSDELWEAYSRVHQHLIEDALEREDPRRISTVASFAVEHQFCDSCSHESQRILTDVLIKSAAMA